MAAIITPSDDFTYLVFSCPELAALILNPPGYTKIEVKATLNCGTEYSQTLPYPFTSTPNLALIGADGVQIFPGFFGGAAVFATGVYSIKVKIFLAVGGNTLIANCAFIDADNTSCKVASTLHNILGEYEDRSEEKPSTLIHLLHYSLVNGSNCGCNCDEMCKNYQALVDLLNNIDPQLKADCGC